MLTSAPSTVFLKQPFRLILFGFLALTSLTCPVARAQPGSIEQWPHFELTDGAWRLLIADPTAKNPYYQGTRFALSGMVVQASQNGFSIFTEASLDKEPSFHDHAGGNADEYDINGPQGSEIEQVGSTFVKIGVGLLKKTKSGKYLFYQDYEVLERPRISVDQREREIEFNEILDLPDQDVRYSLRVLVQILADGSGFSIDRDLTNLGTQNIETTAYSHNFCLLGDGLIGAAYKVDFQGPVRWGDEIAPAGALVPGEQSMNFSGPPTGGDFKAEAFPENNGVISREVNIVNDEHGVALNIQTNRDLESYVLWGQIDKISLEPFVKLSIPPGETANLRSTYRLGSSLFSVGRTMREK